MLCDIRNIIRDEIVERGKKVRYIETLKEGDRIADIYLCKQKNSALTKSGKPYDNLILQDKTGTIDGKIWDVNSQGIDDYSSLDYVDVVADVTSFQGALQLNIKRIRKVSEGEYVPADYLPMSEYPLDGMFDELLEFIESVQNIYLNQLLKKFFVEDQAFAQKFKQHSAAKMVHHGFVGGLLEHTLNVARVSDFYAKMYPILNRDLLLTAAICHDIGKIYELSPLPENDYTDEGNLLGHLVMGSEMIGEVIYEIPGFPKDLRLELKHCILAHHGELEYGSPKRPALAEAIALNFADNVDAKMETMKEMMNGSVDPSSKWMGYNRLFESNIRRTTVDGK